MFIIEVVPLANIPIKISPVLSYFSARDLTAGCLVSVALGKRIENAIVIGSHPIKDLRLDIKNANFEMRPVKKIISDEPYITSNQLKLALWLAQYYFAPPGIFLKMMMGKGIANSISPITNGKKRQELILVPTVAQIDAIEKKYSADDVTIIHSGLKTKLFRENWLKIASGQAKIIIGTRGAAFAPFTGLKEITIMDATNPSHRSWDMFPHYRIREVAQYLAELFGAKLKFKKDLPSIEIDTIDQTEQIQPIDSIKAELIDMRQELAEGNFSIFSRPLIDAIRQALREKKQIILSINRRGLATFVLCRDCGHVIMCPACDTPMAYHTVKEKDGIRPILVCHHCGHKEDPPLVCPKCHGRRIKTLGAGTERVEAEAERSFKKASILRLDSDVAKTPEEQQKIIRSFKEKRADILIGTQMILNGDLPKVPVVAMISADTLLHLPDFNSDEKIFQTITQLKRLLLLNGSKENRPEKIFPPRFFVQTYNPDSKILKLAADGDLQTFYDSQLATRKILKYPPFSQIAKLVFRHRDPKRAGSEAKILKAKLTQQLKTSKILTEVVLDISEAVPAFISKENNKYVWQIIIKFKPYWLASPKSDDGGLASPDERENLLSLRNKILMTVPQGWEIEIDPESLL